MRPESGQCRPAWGAADGLVVDLVRWMVEGTPAERREFLNVEEWRAAYKAASDHRLAGALLGAVEEGWVIAPGGDAKQLEELVLRQMRTCLTIERALVDVAEVFRSSDVEFCVLKGVAVAHVDYSDPSHRSFNDVDLLLAPREVDRATDALERAGCRRDLPPRSPHWDLRFAKDIPMVHPSGVEIDLHRSFAQGAFGMWIDPAELFIDPESFDLAGTELRVCNAAVRAFHALVGITVGETDVRLAHVADFALAVQQMADPQPLVDLCASLHCAVLLDEGVDVVEGVLGYPPRTSSGAVVPSGTICTTTRDRLSRRAYRSAGGSHVLELLSGFLGLRGIGPPLLYARALFLPAREYRRARIGAGRVSEWREGIRQLGGTVRRPR